MIVIIVSEDGECEGIARDTSVETFEEVVRLFRQASLAYGFQPETVKDYFEELDLIYNGQSTPDEE